MIFSELIRLLWITDYEVLSTDNKTSFTITDGFLKEYLDKGIIVEHLVKLSKYYSLHFYSDNIYDDFNSVFKNLNNL